MGSRDNGGSALIHWVRQLMLGSGLLVAGLQHACTCEAPRRVRIGVIRSAGCSVVAVAAQQEFFAHQNLAVDVTFVSWADAPAAVQKNKFDMVCSTLAELVLLPGDFKVVFVPAYSNGADVLMARKDAGADLLGLKGARIGVPEASMGELLLTRALAQQNLLREDFTVLPKAADELREALQKSEIQLAVAAPPQALDILKNPELKVIFRSSAMPGDIVDTVAVTADFLQKHPNLDTQLRNVWQESSRFLDQNPAEAMNLLAKASALPVTTLQQDYKFLTHEEQAAYLDVNGRLAPLIDRLQSTLSSAGGAKSKRTGHEFLPFLPEGSESDP